MKMTMREVLSTIAIVGLAAGRSPGQAPTPQARAAAASEDVICGPRCVREALRAYGRGDEDLVSLAREIQWQDIEAGATLASLAKALETRGISTRAIRLRRDERLCWPHPVVLHFHPEGGNRLGHYALWLPPGPDGLERIWAGTQGLKRGTWEEVASGGSGVALLTAPDPIRDAEAAVYRPKMMYLWMGTTAAAASLALARGLVPWRKARRPIAAG